MPFGYRALGICLVDDVVFMGSNSELLRVRSPQRERFTPGQMQDAEIIERVDLTELGISDIQGLAVDVIQQKLLILDGTQRSLVEIPLELL
ncbi:MAG: hypothetical protein GY822_03195 [Deltaproteobacteria bacterium]|nr:hypothetical protein [Deltaproteobacteria bacterium]